MATFIFNKLIRDKLAAEYEKMRQKATYRSLSKSEFSEALKTKLIEEAHEIIPTDKESIVSELADVYQVIEDLMRLNEISPAEVQKAKEAKFLKKGGFAKAKFVETLELADDDDWNIYYRNQPDVFVELKDNEAKK